MVSSEDLAAAHLSLVPTKDGSLTFFSHRFNESFHSLAGAYTEAIGKFVKPTQLVAKAQQLASGSARLKILDVCYGLGYNSAAALDTIWHTPSPCGIELIGLELDQNVPLAAVLAGGLADWSEPVQAVLSALATQKIYMDHRLQSHLLIGDARHTLQNVIQKGFQADAIFLDPFSPPHCPQLWTVEFIELLSRCLAPTGLLATYSCAAAVRNALKLAGLQIASSVPVGRRAPGTLASFQVMDFPPLSLAEQEHLLTQAGIPYRDPQLQDSAEQIQARRRQEQQESGRESTSSWKRRWGFQSQQ